MHLRHAAFVVVSLLSCLCVRAETYGFKEPFSKSGPFQADGTLSLENVNGAIEIRAWDRNEIRIEGEKSAKTDEELRQIDLTMEVSDSRARIKVRLPKRTGSWFGGGNTIRAAVQFKIHVPAGVTVDRVDAVNSSLTLEGLRGRVRADSVNGAIRAGGLAGDTDLRTVNGSITADFAAVKPDQALNFETVNGSITVALPADAGAKVRGAVVNGSVQSEFPMNGRDAKARHHVDGTIGDGRAKLDAHTVNGRITIERRAT